MPWSNCFIYKITNTVNAKVYVGKTKNMETRWRQHQREGRENKRRHHPLYRDMHDFGVDKFSIEQLEVCIYDWTHFARELYWISHYNSTYPHGYNLDVTGHKKLHLRVPEE